MNALNVYAALEPNDKEHRLAGTCAGRDAATEHGFHVFVGVIGFPRLSIGITQFGSRHYRVVGNVVIEVVFIEVLVHRDAGFV